MKISVFGLGYVGCVSAACLAEAGHQVMGVDVKPEKVALINKGQSPVIEPELERLISRMVKAGRLSATTEAQAAVLESTASIICVGTPAADNGAIDLTFIKRVSQEIATALKTKAAYHSIIYRSTMLPGTTEQELIPLLERNSGKKCAQHFGVSVNPEFLREGAAIKDYHEPPMIVIGAFDDKTAKLTAELYKNIDAPVEFTQPQVAEMIKYANNIFHGLKVCFANEMGNLCKQLGIDSHELMRIFCLDTKLNLSSYYLKPGFAFGGSCLNKDLQALIYLARRCSIPLPLVESIPESNNTQVMKGFDLIRKTGKRKVGLLGLSFKPRTDDLRESPLVRLAEQLIGKGFELTIYDRSVSLSSLIGANKEFIEREIPHISRLMTENAAELLARSEIIVVGKKETEYEDIISRAREGQIIIDLVRIIDKPIQVTAKYEGIGW